ncbi:MAG: choice-of-anchor Q domain-containing protein [Flavobacteriaceae bacterium]
MNKQIFSQTGFAVVAFLLCFFANAQTLIPDSNGIIYVKTAASGNGDGSSWNDATDNLQGAINAENVTKVFVAVGTYSVPLPNSFRLKTGVAVYGGFDPNNSITNLSHNRILPNRGMGDGSVLTANNAGRVMDNINCDNTAVLDGFTITGGYAETWSAGIYNHNYASPTLTNLVIKGNTSYYEGVNSSSNGGGITCVLSSPVISNVIIKGNSAKIGAGVYVQSYSHPVITNTLITDNHVTDGGTGGGIALSNVDVSATLHNVTIADNTGGVADALAINNTNTMSINNSIVFGSVLTVQSGTYTAQHSLVESNTDFTNGNIDASGVSSDAVFTNPAIGDYSLKAAFLINKGNNALFPSLDANTKDLAGNTRLGGYTIDIGAYEYAYSITPTAGIVYVKETASGNASGSSWDDATNDLHNAIHTNGVQKVFVAEGNYDVGAHSFIMKNNVEIYGGFDPDNGITDLSHNRIMPNPANTQGSVLNGENVRPVVWNVFTSSTTMDSTAVLDGFTLMNGNYSNGAGIRNLYASPTLRNLVIRNNNASLSGAGMYNDNSSPAIINSVISSNSINSAFAQSGMGAGIYNGTNSAPTLINTTITDNRLTGIGASPVMVGAGMANLNGAAPEIYNCIIWNNKKNNDATASGADIENISAGITLKNSITQGYTTGNTADNNKVNINPIFVSASDFSLQGVSPAVNTGNNSWFTGLNADTKDLAGNARLFTGTIDMGAYEFQLLPDANHIIYVKETATGTKSGNSWGNATSDLHNAIHTAGVQKVFVATGNYNVGANSFVMKNNVEIYGGFDPDNGIEDLNDNRILPTETLNGSVLNGQGTRAVIWNDFSPANALNNSAKLDGFTITNGDSFGNGEEGGGMHNVNASVTLNNLIIKNNWAYYGAGLYNWGGAPVLNNVIITDNHAMFGGAMSNKETAPVLTNVIIKNNEAQYGGGFYNLTASPVLINTLMYNNIDGVSGTNETMYNRQSSVPVLINSTVVGNIHNSEGSSISFSNAIFYGEIDGNGSYTSEYSLIKGNTNTSNGNLDGTGMYLGTIFNNLSEEDYTLKNGSPAINAGNNALFTGLDENTEDLAGNPRVQNFADGGIIDLGAYESPYEGLTPDGSGIIYVNTAISGDGSGKDWNNTTSNLHNAIHANGVQKVFVATGNYNVGANSFIMKNGVEIYGGFDPDNNIKTLDDERILPNRGTAEGSVLNGQNVRPVIWNVFTSGTALNTSAVLDGFTVMNGLGDTDGGGIRNIYASPTLRNLVVKNNSLSSTLDTYGGGIFNGYYCSPVITNVVIKENTAKFGGGLFTNGSTCEPVLTNVLIMDNIGTVASQYGGAYEAGKATYTNVTIAGNTGKQLYVNNSNTQLNNVIVLGANTGGITTGIIQNSLISGFTDTSNGNLDATGITAEDIFTDPANGDYTLKENSPAINSGSNALFTGLDENTLDVAGNGRVYNFSNSGIIDLGAYESFYSRLIPDANGIIYVKENATGNADGSSWDDATDDLHKAIFAVGVQKVFVAVGNYSTGDNSFVMKNNVEIYGGFDPDNGIEDLNDNRILPTETIGGSVLDGENTRTVILNDFTVGNPLNNTAVLDGFTLTQGRNVPGNGGGIYNYYASPVLTNLVIKNSVASNGGGAMYNRYSNSVVTNISLLNNTAYAGGGVFNYESSVAFSNITISGNTASGDGGAIYNDLSSHVFTNIKITGNTGADSSVVLNTESDVTFINAEITGNHTVNPNSSADIYNSYGGNILFLNSTFAYNNSAKTFRNTSFDGEIQVKNSIVFDAIDDWDEFTAEYSFIQDNENDSNGNIVLDINEDDVFTNPDNEDFTLKINSPVINLGNNVLYSSLDENTLDLAGNPRLFGTNIDLGAYELQSNPSNCSASTTWNGTSWSNGEPDYNIQAIIDGDLVISYELDACEVVVTPNGSLRVLTEAVLYTDWSVTNLATADDFVIENNGALIQWEDVENDGAITVQRETSPMFRLDYTLWSSPVSGMLLKDFSDVSPSGGNGTLWNRVYELGAAAWEQVWATQADYLADNSNTFTKAKGYLYRAKNDWITRDSGNPAEEDLGIFTGVPNNGNITIATPLAFNAIGNPYPSPVEAEDFLAQNPGILYFWTNVNASNGTAYTNNNWAYYVAGFGGTGVADMADGGTIIFKPEDDMLIQPGQGFVIGTEESTVTFNNSMRATANGDFFKQMSNERHRFWLNLSNEEVVFNQILVGYLENATQGVDNGIDAKMFSYEGNAIYSLIENNEEKFVIQGRELPFTDSDIVPVGFRAVNAGSFSISLNNFNGIFEENVVIYLKDNYTQAQHNLNSGAYTFVSEEGVFDNRFEVIYQTTMSVENPDWQYNWVVFKQDKGFQVQTQGFEMKKVSVYDLLGRNIYTSKAEGTTHQIPALGASGVYIVKVTTTEDKVLNKKVR